MREFVAGVRLLVRGFGFWRTHPRLMALGLIPAFIAFFLLLAALIPFAFALGTITDALTPFADDWVSPWREILRVGLGIVLLIAAMFLAGAVFTALTLTIGDPFYQRIWRGVERSLGDEPTGETGFWAAVGEGIRLIVLGILVALLTLVIGFLPLVGSLLAWVIGVVLTGRLLARELTGRAFDARGLTTYTRSEILATGRARVLGFGVATQLCFLVPLGAIVTMPAAVAGSTLLARELTLRAAGSGAPGDGTATPGAGTHDPGTPATGTPPAPSQPHPAPPPGTDA